MVITRLPEDAGVLWAGMAGTFPRSTRSAMERYLAGPF